MTLLTTHKNFYQHTTALAQELTAIEMEVKQHEQALFAQINTLTLAVKKASQAKQPKVVSEAIKTYFDQTNQVLEAWQKKVNSFEAGLSFRKKFGDSLLVFVYGKVKAGKSSLGNYIATGRSEFDSDWMNELATQLHQPEFFSEEVNLKFEEEINYEQGFQVGEKETTGCIQGFTVPGLTWVDSPGLHSTNTENGDLAQKYVESADLIIYPMNSAQPGRSTDFQVLEELLKAGKRVLILITRSDYTETDYDETGKRIDTRTMKTDKNRQDQEAYVQNEVDKLCEKLGVTNADTSALSISVAYAEEHGNSIEAMNASGLPALFNKLEAIIGSEGIALKKKTPQINLQAFYRALLEEGTDLSFTGLLTPLQEALDTLNKQQQSLERITDQAKTRINYTVANMIDQLVEEHAASRDIDALESALDLEIKEAIAKEYQQPLQELYQTAIGALAEVPTSMGASTGLSFTDKSHNIVVDISKKSAAIGGGIGASAGALAGFLIGGPIGSMAGSLVGGLAGGKAGSYFNSQEVRTIKCGDNREEIKDLLLNKSDEAVEDILINLKTAAKNEVLTPLESALKQVHQQALTLQNFIQEQVKDV